MEPVKNIEGKSKISNKMVYKKGKGFRPAKVLESEDGRAEPRILRWLNLRPSRGPQDVQNAGASAPRPVRRKAAFAEAFKSMTEKFGGESRKVRRSMARDLSKRVLKGVTA